ncbi:LUD domain-containing protein, partial [Candidatus Gracilibacteria bacterium]|nr:LUD domain-containing protein [Candidatus Gracilibacteria bacterium]
LLLRHGPGRPRIASLLAPVHIAVVRPTQLVRGLGAALATLRERYGDALFRDTSNLTLITGPSRTADIEMTLTLGIHGPRELHVVLVNGGRTLIERGSYVPRPLACPACYAPRAHLGTACPGARPKQSECYRHRP